jgi:hypothetical protein
VDISECQACLGGHYCDRTNLTAPSGQCDVGHYCAYGVDMATPSGANTGSGDICPIGHYCPIGTTLPLGCDPGTYQVGYKIFCQHFQLSFVVYLLIHFGCLLSWLYLYLFLFCCF